VRVVVLLGVLLLVGVGLGVGPMPIFRMTFESVSAT
jgi:hypothetical protein